MLIFVVRMIVAMSLMAAILFGSAGRWDLPFFWAFLALLILSICAGWLLLDPTLIRERTKPGPGGEDRAFRWILFPFFIAHLAIAGLDAGRFGWSGDVPEWLQFAGLVVFGAGMTLLVWASHVNRFFSPVVRIQTERGHHLVTGGPYRWLRHPGYLAQSFMTMGSGLALGSYWSMIAVAPVIALILRRTNIEDRFLAEHLDGYGEYAQGVRFRLIPGIW